LNCPHAIVIATPNENPSRTAIGISVQYFSNFKRNTIKEKIPAPTATIGMMSSPFYLLSSLKLLTRAPAGPKML